MARHSLSLCLSLSLSLSLCLLRCLTLILRELHRGLCGVHPRPVQVALAVCQRHDSQSETDRFFFLVF